MAPLPTTTDSYRTALVETKAALVPSGTAYPEAWFVDLLGGRITASKVRVNPKSAMGVPAVARAVNLIANTLGALPCRVLKLDEKGGQAAATDHPAFPIVARRANPWTAASEFRAQLTRDALLHGNGYAYVSRVGGKVREFIRLEPSAVSVELDERTREPFYRATVDGTSQEYTWREILHVPAPSLDGVRGASPIHLGREAIGLAITLERHAARLFGNGARPGGIVSVADKLGHDAAQRMKAGWQTAFGGEGSGGTAVLEQGATFHPVTLSAVDAEFNATRQHQTREIANVFGVPATMLNDLSSATFSNAEALGQAFRDETILPVVTAWEAALERVLLDEEELAAFRIAFDLEALDRADLAAKADAIAKRRAAGVSTANEERARVGMPAHPRGNELGSPFTTANAGQPAQEAPARV